MSAWMARSRSTTSLGRCSGVSASGAAAAMCIAICLPSAASFVLVGRRLQRDEHADLAELRRRRVVDIGGDDARIDARARPCGARSCSRRSWRRDRSASAARVRRRPSACASSFSRSPLCFERDAAPRSLHEVLELVVARDEVGLGIDLDERARVAADGDADQAFGGDAAGLLRGLGRGPSCAASRSRLPCRRWSRSAPSCNPSCPRRSCRAGPSPSLR